MSLSVADLYIAHNRKASNALYPSVSHKPVLNRNDDWRNLAGFWHGGFLPPIPHCIIRKFGYLKKLGELPSETLSLTPQILPLQVDRVVTKLGAIAEIK